MGGCCCGSSSRRDDLNGAPVYYCCPGNCEEHSWASSRNAIPSGQFDIDQDSSFPNAYRAPPTPLPYNNNLGCHICHGVEDILALPGRGANGRCSLESLLASENLGVKDPDKKSDAGDVDLDCSKLTEPFTPIIEEDVCPICLEEYDADNPKLLTKCEHHFHLACILEWMERSDTCPVCDQEAVLDHDVYQ